MKSIGVVRRVDELGRIVLPVELRRTLRIKASKNKSECTPLEIFTEGDQIVLRKYEPTCIFCGETENLTEYKGKKICNECLKLMAQKFKDITKDSVWRDLR